MERDVLSHWDMPSRTRHSRLELASSQSRVVIHGLLTIAALFVGAGTILLMRGGDDPVADAHAEQVVAPIVTAAPKALPPIVLPNLDNPKPAKHALATR